MNKSQWIAFFQATNGRYPSQEEIEQALAIGAIVENQPTNSQSTQEANVSQPLEDSTLSQAQALQETFMDVQGEPVLATPSADVRESDQEQAKNEPSPVYQEPQQVTPQVDTQASQVQPSPQPQVSNPESVATENPTWANPQMQTQVPPAPKKTNKKIWKVLALMAAVLVLSGIGAGGYVAWRYQSANLRGSWLLEDWQYYNSKQKKWENGLASYRRSRETYTEMITVDKDNQIKVSAYGIMRYELSDDTDSMTILSLDSQLKPYTKVAQWDKTIEPSMSKSDYKSMLEKYYHKNDYLTDDEIEEYVKDEVKTVYGSSKTSYDVKGNTLTVTTKSKKGKIIAKKTYKRLSKAATKERKEVFKEAKYDSKHEE